MSRILKSHFPGVAPKVDSSRASTKVQMNRNPIQDDVSDLIQNDASALPVPEKACGRKSE
jgi:hypothetical protein